MILNFSYSFKEESRTGIVMDAISIEKYLEMGSPEDPFYPEDFTGSPAIRIERRNTKPIELVFTNSKNRDLVYNSLMAQVKKYMNR